MTHVPLDEVIFGVVDVLEAQGADYALIGGLAANAYGFARATLDVDICVAVERGDREAVSAILDGLEASGFRCNRPAIDRRLDEGRALVTVWLGLTRADLFFRRPNDGWDDVLAHHRPVQLGGRSVLVASPEDLIAVKLVAARPRDLEDAQGVIDVARERLDLVRLRAAVRELAGTTGASHLIDQLEAMLLTRPG